MALFEASTPRGPHYNCRGRARAGTSHHKHAQDTQARYASAGSKPAIAQLQKWLYSNMCTRSLASKWKIFCQVVTHNHSTPRHVAMYLIEKMALCNAREVGERFNRAKSVVRKSCQRVESFLKNTPNDKISRAVTSITRQLAKEGLKL
jgi:hypothetical protein